MNFLAQTESYYTLALNAPRELIYNSTLPILNHDSFEIAKESL